MEAWKQYNALTAKHEAGHIVGAHVQKLDVGAMIIEWGKVGCWDSKPKGATLKQMEGVLIAFLCGAAAEHLLLGKVDWGGCCEDACGMAHTFTEMGVPREEWRERVRGAYCPALELLDRNRELLMGLSGALKRLFNGLGVPNGPTPPPRGAMAIVCADAMRHLVDLVESSSPYDDCVNTLVEKMKPNIWNVTEQEEDVLGQEHEQESTGNPRERFLSEARDLLNELDQVYENWQSTRNQ